MTEIFLFIEKLLSLIPIAIQVGGDVTAIINNGKSALEAMEAENRGPTEAEWSNLNATIDGLMGQLKDQ